MKARRTALSPPRIRRLLPDVLEKVGPAHAERLKAIVALLDDDGHATLSACLREAFPGKATADAQAHFRGFRKAVNDAAKAARIGLEFRVDTSKKRAPSARNCWFESDDSTPRELIEFSEQGTTDVVDVDIESRAWVTTSEMIEAPGRVRIFVSYPSEHRAHAKELVDRLEVHWRAHAGRLPEPCWIWGDWELEGGEKWGARIRAEIESCNIGLFLFNVDALASRFINDVELPPFLDGDKPLVPVRFGPCSEKAPRFQALRKRFQFIELRRPGKGQPPLSWVDVRRDENRRAAFVESILSAIVAALVELRGGSVPDVPVVSSGFRRAKPDLEQLTKHLVSGEGDGFYEPADATSIGLDELERLDLSKDLPAGRSGRAVEVVEKWARDPQAPSFFAVLGELGIGKTTALKQVTRSLLDGQSGKNPGPLPIFVDLRLYGGDGGIGPARVPSLEELLEEVVRSHWKGGGKSPLTAEEIIDAVQNQGALLIVDGLDEKLVHYTPAQARQFIRELWRILPPTPESPQERATKRQRIEKTTSVAPDTKRGKLLLSCRSHYFRDAISQTAMLTGEGRDGIRPAHYGVCIVLPFTEEQIRHYLTAVLGGEDKAAAALELFASIHNLTDLARRPYLLSIMTEQIEELRRRRTAGEVVLGVSLYELLVGKWLSRDDGKHLFTQAHKLLMMEQLAAALTADAARSWRWDKVEAWLASFLHRRPEIGELYRGRDPELLNEDFRTATFVLRPDDSREQFRFAHTSLQEYFHARSLYRALDEENLAAWEIESPSIETVDFVGQMLQLDAGTRWLRSLEQLLVRGAARAARLALRYWLLAMERGYPEPAPERARLGGLDLEGWRLAGRGPGRMLMLAGADLSGARLDHARLEHVYLAAADLRGSTWASADLTDVVLNDATIEGADFTGATWRGCGAARMSGKARWYDADLIECDLPGSDLGADFGIQGTLTRCATDEGYPSMPRDVPADLAAAVRNGHTDPVTCCAWSPDGRRLVSGSDDNTLRLWDAESGRCVRTLEGHTNGVMACAWSPDGRRLVSGSDDNTLRLWDAESGRCVRTLEGHTNGVMACAWSPDGRRLVSGSDDKTLRLWDAESGRCVRTLEGHTNGVMACAWSPDGRRLVSGSYDKTLRLWDAESGRCVRTLEGHTNWVMACAWSPDGRRLVSGSYDKTLRLWDAESGRCVRTLEGHTNWVMACAWSPDGRRLVSGSYDKTLRLWDAESGRCVRTLEGHTNGVMACAWSPDGRRLVSGSYDKTLRLWDAESGRCVRTLEGHTNGVMACAWSPDGRRLVSGSYDKTLRLWDAESGRCVRTLEGHTNWVMACAWSPDGRRLVSGSYDKTLRLWDAESGRCVRTLEGHTNGVMACAWSPDGRRLVSGSYDKTLRLWDAESGRCVRTLEGHTNGVRACAWSPDGRRLVSGSDDNTLRLWDAESGRCVRTLEGHTNGVMACAWSPDGRRLVSGSYDKTLRLWDAESGRCVRTLEGHTNGVMACAWSPDGRRLVSGSYDKTLRLWDAESGRCVRTLEGHTNGVMACAWSPDGRRLVSGSYDKTLRLWDAESGGTLMVLAHVAPGEVAAIDPRNNRFVSVSPGAPPHLGWRYDDPVAGRTRILPAEFFGPLPVHPPD